MSFKIVVLAKQVPDTRNVGKDAMTAEGTVNRAALPAIFNPEDLNALEMALHIKDNIKDAEVIVLTMGPSRAADIIRDSLYRGADCGYVISDRKVAGSDTLATSYTISQGVKKLGKVDLILAGRQAIDGDTAQVGPQVAEKLKIPQITYAEEVVKVCEEKIQIKRRLERGIEIEADVMMKGTRVDGIYTADPEKDPSAVKFNDITYDEILERNLKVMDLSATVLCKDNNLPIYVFNMDVYGNLFKVLNGEHIGTFVHP